MAKRTTKAEVEAAAQFVAEKAAPLLGEAYTTLEVSIPAVLEQGLGQMIEEAAAQADEASAEAAALVENARQEWNNVFYLIKALKPRLKDDEALRTSKLGTLLNKLP
jgi:hypothetical protein